MALLNLPQSPTVGYRGQWLPKRKSQSHASCFIASVTGHLSCQQEQPVDRRYKSISTSPQHISHPHIPQYAIINRRWPSFSGCCGSCLQQSTAARHIRAVTASLPLSPYISRRCFPWLCCCAWEVTSSYSDPLVVFLTYLLTYITASLNQCTMHPQHV